MTTNVEYAEGLRNLAGWIEAHPSIPLPEPMLSVWSANTKDDAVACLRALGNAKKQYEEQLFYISGEFGPLTLRFVFERNAVCTRKVVGTKRVEAVFHPAHEEEIVEWDCEESLLRPESEGKEVLLQETIV